MGEQVSLCNGAREAQGIMQRTLCFRVDAKMPRKSLCEGCLGSVGPLLRFLAVQYPHLLFPYCLKARLLLCREVILPVPNHAFPQEAGNGEIHHRVPCAIGAGVHTHVRK